MPEDLANPPVCRLIDAMTEESALLHPGVAYVIALGPATSLILRRNSDSALRRHEMKSDEYLGRAVLSLDEVDEDMALLIPAPSGDGSSDKPCVVGLVSSGRFRIVQMSEREHFDLSSLRDEPRVS
jgi:hypothetical protein